MAINKLRKIKFCISLNYKKNNYEEKKRTEQKVCINREIMF